jgi:hypothetical protein
VWPSSPIPGSRRAAVVALRTDTVVEALAVRSTLVGTQYIRARESHMAEEHHRPSVLKWLISGGLNPFSHVLRPHLYQCWNVRQDVNQHLN